jgi:hypothetical protein
MQCASFGRRYYKLYANIHAPVYRLIATGSNIFSIYSDEVKNIYTLMKK